ncbi:hypothetical protein [Streptomyces sp. NPDC051677]|uniref:hypothetical protein n=1 Tax=Streptomyces sp. NPDC051677 TaxID=3365669 RepID=UPI0037D162FD
MAWVLATIAADLDAWTRLLLLHDKPELAAAEPETIRMKLYHLPARLTAHARRRTLHLDRTWPWTRRSQRHATAHLDTARDIPGNQPLTTSPSALGRIEVNGSLAGA